MRFKKAKRYAISADDDVIAQMGYAIAKHGGCSTGTGMLRHAMALAMRVIDEEQALMKVRAAMLAEKSLKEVLDNEG